VTDNGHVSRELLLALAARTAYPAVRLGGTLIGDEGAWRYAASRATPAERVTLLLTLRDELLRATEGGRARVAAARMRHHREVDDAIYLRGDSEALPLLLAAFALLPEEVRWQLQRETCFLAVGRSSRAWMSPVAFIDVAGQAKAYVVVLGPGADVRTILHELGHVWNAGPPRADAVGISDQGERGLVALAVRDGWSERLARWERAEEHLAEGLALCWLLAPPENERRPA
jgi:hypothetical protein